MIPLARAALVAFALLALVAGCGDGEPSAKRPRATATADRTPAPPSAPRARSVRFHAADGRPVTGRYTVAGEGAPAVVLLHEIRGGPDQWAPLIPYLHAAGFSTLAYRSRASVLEHERLPDAIGAIRWLRARRGVQRIALVGASIGASTAALAMATGARRTADAAVALSPPDSADIWALQDAGRYRPHDLLLVSDDRESPSARSFLPGAVRSAAIRSDRPGHGVALLQEARVRRALLDWLDERVGRHRPGEGADRTPGG